MNIKTNRFISFIGICIGLNAFTMGCGNTEETHTAPPFVLSGGYYFNLSGQYPLIALTNIKKDERESSDLFKIKGFNSFYTFSYVEFLAAMLPNAGIAADLKSVNTAINSIDCVKNTCSAVGNYQSTLTASKPPKLPLILNSTDGGETWQAVFTGSEFFAAVSDLDETKPAGVQLNSVSCNQDLCVAVGTYVTTVGVEPLLIVSNDGGATWQVKIQASTYAANAGTLTPSGNTSPVSAGFLDVSCSESICAAVGNYFTSSGTTANVLVAQSTDSGATWVFKTIELANIPGTLNTVDCLHGVCAAGGNDSVHATPYFVISINNGNLWRAPSSTAITATKPNFDRIIHKTTVSGPVIGDFVNANAYLGVSCTQTLCAAAGSYIATDTFTYPVVSIYDVIQGGFLSHPIGKTSYLSIYDSKASDKGTTAFNAICCNESFCAAAGTYYNTMNNQIAFMATSKQTDTQALGNIWEYTITSNNQMPNISENSTDTAFNAVDCYKNFAVAVGRYNVTTDDSSTSERFAAYNGPSSAKSSVSQFLAISGDEGDNWTYEILNNNRPKDPNHMPNDSVGSFATVVIGGH